ncbi:unnamed protein product, partial [marine sediment metagenome]
MGDFPLSEVFIPAYFLNYSELLLTDHRTFHFLAYSLDLSAHLKFSFLPLDCFGFAFNDKQGSPEIVESVINFVQDMNIINIYHYYVKRLGNS